MGMPIKLKPSSVIFVFQSSKADQNQLIYRLLFASYARRIQTRVIQNRLQTSYLKANLGYIFNVLSITQKQALSHHQQTIDGDFKQLHQMMKKYLGNVTFAILMPIRFHCFLSCAQAKVESSKKKQMVNYQIDGLDKIGYGCSAHQVSVDQTPNQLKQLIFGDNAKITIQPNIKVKSSLLKQSEGNEAYQSPKTLKNISKSTTHDSMTEETKSESNISGKTYSLQDENTSLNQEAVKQPKKQKKCHNCGEDAEENSLKNCKTCLNTYHLPCYFKIVNKKDTSSEKFQCEKCQCLIQLNMDPLTEACQLCPQLKGAFISFNDDQSKWKLLACPTHSNIKDFIPAREAATNIISQTQKIQTQTTYHNKIEESVKLSESLLQKRKRPIKANFSQRTIELPKRQVKQKFKKDNQFLHYESKVQIESNNDDDELINNQQIQNKNQLQDEGIMDWDFYEEYFKLLKSSDLRKLQDYQFDIVDLEELKEFIINQRDKSKKKAQQATQQQFGKESFSLILEHQNQISHLTFEATDSCTNGLKRRKRDTKITPCQQNQGSIIVNNILRDHLKLSNIKAQNVTVSKSEVNQAYRSYQLSSFTAISKTDLIEDDVINESLIKTHIDQTFGLNIYQSYDEIDTWLLLLAHQQNQLVRQTRQQFDCLLYKLINHKVIVDPQLKLAVKAEKFELYDHFHERMTWQLVRRSLLHSYNCINPSDESNNMKEVKFCCKACFYSDLVDANPIVICEICELGVHAKCYGIQDLIEQFFCDKCKHQRADEKNLRLSVYKEQMIRSIIKDTVGSKIKDRAILNGEIMRKSALSIYYENLTCIFCEKKGGLMKKVDLSCDQIPNFYLHEGESYYHAFCGMAVGKYRNIIELQQFKLKSKYQHETQTQPCVYCNIEKGVTVSCSSCHDHKNDNSDYFHHICSWLNGHTFDLYQDKLRGMQFQKHFNQNLDTESIKRTRFDYLPLDDVNFADDPIIAIKPLNQDEFADMQIIDEDYSDYECSSESTKKQRSNVNKEFNVVDDLSISSDMEDLPDKDDYDKNNSQSLFSIARNYSKYKVRYYDAYPASTKIYCAKCRPLNKEIAFIRQAKFDSVQGLPNQAP
ncbi:phd zinc finger-containing protein [Stylonychia lemnae]|uniref:Phd zinc finger-containing protein n=1 Tax=Stylonychia lemnae TaxID=5949 RepID=A0A078B4R7_STYLE|nr:phd zinc finger-containing protein [Stylonychia lemnae]|eukprot:CDW88513.1 phd zinc finger-containing protein [Stylonychia lemnae]